MIEVYHSGDLARWNGKDTVPPIGYYHVKRRISPKIKDGLDIFHQLAPSPISDVGEWWIYIPNESFLLDSEVSYLCKLEFTHRLSLSYYAFRLLKFWRIPKK